MSTIRDYLGNRSPGNGALSLWLRAADAVGTPWQSAGSVRTAREAQDFAQANASQWPTWTLFRAESKRRARGQVAETVTQTLRVVLPSGLIAAVPAPSYTGMIDRGYDWASTWEWPSVSARYLMGLLHSVLPERATRPATLACVRTVLPYLFEDFADLGTEPLGAGVPDLGAGWAPAFLDLAERAISAPDVWLRNDLFRGVRFRERISVRYQQSAPLQNPPFGEEPCRFALRALEGVARALDMAGRGGNAAEGAHWAVETVPIAHRYALKSPNGSHSPAAEGTSKTQDIDRWLADIVRARIPLSQPLMAAIRQGGPSVNRAPRRQR